MSKVLLTGAGGFIGSRLVERLVAEGRHVRAFDMPELFDAYRAAGLPTLAYPIQEYWVDIGQIDDYRRANEEFDRIF